MKSYQITAWSHELFKLQVTPGGVYIDATMGNGYDTQFLCEMAGETGKVWAFDIQEQALKATKERLEKHGLLAKAELILDSHTQMEQYVKPDSVDGIYFNFGYLPGGDHELATKGRHQCTGSGNRTASAETGRCYGALYLQRRGYGI